MTIRQGEAAREVSCLSFARSFTGIEQGSFAMKDNDCLNNVTGVASRPTFSLKQGLAS